MSKSMIVGCVVVVLGATGMGCATESSGPSESDGQQIRTMNVPADKVESTMKHLGIERCGWSTNCSDGSVTLSWMPDCGH